MQGAYVQPIYALKGLSFESWLISSLNCRHFEGKVGVKILFYKVEDKWSPSYVLSLCHVA